VDKATGRPRKIAVPGWLAEPLFSALRHGKVLRGSWADPFGWQAERRAERALVSQYVADVEAMLERLRPETLDTAVALAELPDMIRGFGPVKDANRTKAAERRAELLARMQAGQPAEGREPVAVAAE
jgi:indolepyruvate ferredoxin oxidoreductase